MLTILVQMVATAVPALPMARTNYSVHCQNYASTNFNLPVGAIHFTTEVTDPLLGNKIKIDQTNQRHIKRANKL